MAADLAQACVDDPKVQPINVMWGARRPALARACDGENAFDVIIMHSFSRFFRDAFGLEFYVRKLAEARRQAGVDHTGTGRARDSVDQQPLS